MTSPLPPGPPARLPARPSSRPVERLHPGERGGVSARVHHADLAVTEHGVGAHDDPQRFFGRGTTAEEVEAQLAVCGVGKALRRHRANACLGPRHDAADVGKLGLHRDTEIAGGGVPGDDAVGVGELLEVSGRISLSRGQRKKGQEHGRLGRLGRLGRIRFYAVTPFFRQ
jgi:hypothetical protein